MINKTRLKEDFDCLLRATCRDAAHRDVRTVYNAFSRAVMANLFDDWEKNRNAQEKRCGYFSAEFLIGRTIFSNLLNLEILQDCKTLLAEYGADLYAFEQIGDAALGNGGLGRLAACFLDSGACVGLPLDGYGLRYRYGLFRQKFSRGFQKELPDDWLRFGDPWSVRKEEEKVRVDFADFSVYAVPYDMPVIGYKNGVINTLRLWQSEPLEPFDFEAFDKMEGEKIAQKNFAATSVTDVLYPNDNTEKGKLLRLRQQYLLTSASLQDFFRKYDRSGAPYSELAERQVFQLNDTHPVLAIPEFIRLSELRGVSFEESVATASKVFRFTNHTIMGEALERWQTETLDGVLPEVYAVVQRLQKRLERENLPKDRYYIVKDGAVHMANLAVYVCEKVNGVAEIHTGILKKETFADWYALYPNKFLNVTNGITPRRWLILNNSKTARLITEKIGAEWVSDLTQLQKLTAYIDDADFRRRFAEIKRENKEKLVEYIRMREGTELPADFLFDTQVKRLHEYKRQLMNAFSVLYIYNALKRGELPNFRPTVFLFGAKAAPGYYNAKAIIKYINEIARKVNSDEDVRGKLRVAFVQNYDVSYAEKIVCATDVSEQISMAGMEASGTSNMKFMLNGTVTLGTLDGANVEICKEAGEENNFIFGARVEEIPEIKRAYSPKALLARNDRLREVVESLKDGTFEDDGTGFFESLYASLTEGKDADRYLVLYDFESYLEKKLVCNAEYGKESFLTKSLYNMAHAGKFSSDRSIREYAKNIWGIEEENRFSV